MCTSSGLTRLIWHLPALAQRLLLARLADVAKLSMTRRHALVTNVRLTASIRDTSVPWPDASPSTYILVVNGLVGGT